MSEIILASTLPVPAPKMELTIRDATLADVTAIDELQKIYNKNLGFLPTKALEGKINLKQVLIAENQGEMLGYIIAQDRYFKRDEIGIVTQLVVAPGNHRSFIGAALLKAQFDRSHYGCRLYCCWCAQDLPANHFWESMGFYPLAFRNGSEAKTRVHIFWEKKIRGKDDAINWWYPHKTDQGQMRADRLVFPIPSNVHWKDVQPMEMPKSEEEKLLEGEPVKRTRSQKVVKKEEPSRRNVINRFRLSAPITPEPIIEAPKEKPARVKKPKVKINPELISKAKELRDRYLEQVNEHGYKLESAGKYELTREIRSTPGKPVLRIAA